MRLLTRPYSFHRHFPQTRNLNNSGAVHLSFIFPARRVGSFFGDGLFPAHEFRSRSTWWPTRRRTRYSGAIMKKDLLSCDCISKRTLNLNVPASGKLCLSGMRLTFIPPPPPPTKDTYMHTHVHTRVSRWVIFIANFRIYLSNIGPRARAARGAMGDPRYAFPLAFLGRCFSLAFSAGSSSPSLALLLISRHPPMCWGLIFCARSFLCFAFWTLPTMAFLWPKFMATAGGWRQGHGQMADER